MNIYHDKGSHNFYSFDDETYKLFLHCDSISQKKELLKKGKRLVFGFIKYSAFLTLIGVLMIFIWGPGISNLQLSNHLCISLFVIYLLKLSFFDNFIRKKLMELEGIVNETSTDAKKFINRVFWCIFSPFLLGISFFIRWIILLF